MSRFLALSLVSLWMLFAANGQAQTPVGSNSSIDSSHTMPPPDSLHALDSAYRARKVALNQWIHEQRKAGHPQDDFLSVYAEYGGYMQILPRDLNQLFSERTLRPDHQADRESYENVDRALVLGGAVQLSRTWGIYAEYNFTAKFANTIVDDSTKGPQSLSGVEEALDLTEHAFVVGGMIVFYTSPFYRLRASGAIGGVYALTSETEAGGFTRSASATGYQINFDLLNDFRVMESASVTIDLLTRSVTTGVLKTSGGTTLDAPFGRRTEPFSLSPSASNVVYGFAVGFVYYF